MKTPIDLQKFIYYHVGISHELMHFYLNIDRNIKNFFFSFVFSL